MMKVVQRKRSQQRRNSDGEKMIAPRVLAVTLLGLHRFVKNINISLAGWMNESGMADAVPSHL
jgi:hypothetical protein